MMYRPIELQLEVGVPVTIAVILDSQCLVPVMASAKYSCQGDIVVGNGGERGLVGDR